MVEEKAKKEEQIAKVIEVTATTAPAFQLENGDIIEHNEMLIRLYNKLCKIERAIA